MTKGHRHTAPEGEVYEGLAGRGGLLLFDGTRHRWIELAPGSVGYIPPGWAHRTVNTGREPFRFLAVYPGAVGHDYEAVLRDGMGARVVRDGDGYEVQALEATS
jgi:glucose-6-phosphate isomerase